MNRKRIIADKVKEFFTWISSGISALVLFAILFFIFSKGWNTLSWDLLRTDYNSSNIMAGFEHIEWDPEKTYDKPGNLPENAAFSERFGIAFSDEISAGKDHLIRVVYLDPESPLQNGTITTAGANKGKTQPLSSGLLLKKITFLDAAGERGTGGMMSKEGNTAADLAEILDTKATEIVDYYAQTQGGGLRGSIKTTLILIGITLLIALPIGIFSAIYLNELAPKNKLTAILRSSIELLAGVPSIIFGLMGMTMLFPVTQLMGIQGQSVTLGAMTLAVILLPVIIRQIEEALINVPVGMRMASLSLGATRFQTIAKVVIPNSLPGILTATLLSISRIIGESAALIFTIGTAITDNPTWATKGTSLAVHIWSVMSGEQPNFELASAISIVILIIVLILNVSVKVITYYMVRDKGELDRRKQKQKAAKAAKAGV